MEPTGNTQFTREAATENTMLVLDMKIQHKEDGSIKVIAYKT